MIQNSIGIWYCKQSKYSYHLPETFIYVWLYRLDYTVYFDLLHIHFCSECCNVGPQHCVGTLKSATNLRHHQFNRLRLYAASHMPKHIFPFHCKLRIHIYNIYFTSHFLHICILYIPHIYIFRRKDTTTGKVYYWCIKYSSFCCW